MRVMLKVQVPAEQGNVALADGSFGRLVEEATKDLKAEAVYFLAEDGVRTGLFFFDMPDSTYMPFVAERFFQGLNAKLTMTPTMTVDDLQKGLARMQQG